MLDDLEGDVHVRSFGEGSPEGIVSMMIHSAKSHALTYAEGGQVEPMLGTFNLLSSCVLWSQACCPPLHNSVKT
jgi:hypothetical protein